MSSAVFGLTTISHDALILISINALRFKIQYLRKEKLKTENFSAKV